MPDDLRRAHLNNDAAVLAAYSFNENMSEDEIITALLGVYKIMTNNG